MIVYPQLVGQIGGNTAGATALVSTGTFEIRGGANITIGQTGNTLQISGAAGGGGGGAAGTISAGTTNVTLGALSFGNANGISFGLNGSTLTASYTVPSTAGLLSAINLSAGTTSSNASAFAFNNGNGVSFGINGTVITGSHNGLTSQSNQALSGSNGSFTFQTATFGNLNGLSFYTSNGSLVGSYTVPSTAGLISAINISAGTTSSNASAFLFNNANGISFGIAGAVITGSHNGLTSQSNQALSGSNGSFTFQTATFGNLNGLSFYTSNGSLVGSYTVPSVPAQTNQTIGLYAVGNTTNSSSGTQDARSLSFFGAGIASVGVTNGSVQISVPSGGGGGDGGNTLAAGSQTAASAGLVVFANSNRVTFGMAGSSQITAQIGDLNVRVYEQGNPVAFGQLTHSTLWLQKFNLCQEISATALDILLAVSNSASAGWTATVSFGVFSLNGSTASMLSSATRTIGYNSTAAASSYTAMSATRWFSTPVTFNLSTGEYLLGMIWNTSSSGTSGSHSFAVNRSLITVQQDPFAGGNRTRGFLHGVYSAATGAFPNTIHLTQINQSSNVAQRTPYFVLAGTY